MNVEILKKITQIGLLGYDLDKALNIIDADHEVSEEIRQQWFNQDSEVYRAYKKGIDIADFKIDKALFEAAADGDIKALEKLDFRKMERQKNAAKKSARNEIAMIENQLKTGSL